MAESTLGQITFTTRSDGWDRGGTFAPGSDSAAQVSGGRDWQAGWPGYDRPFAPGSNSMGPMQTQNIVVYPYNIRWLKGDAQDWHKFLCHNFCFNIYDKTQKLETRFEQRYGIKTLYPGSNRTWPSNEPRAADDIYKDDNKVGLYNANELNIIVTMVGANYCLLAEFFDKHFLTATEVAEYLRPLGVCHTQADVDDIDKKGYPMFNAPTDVQNFTIQGPRNTFEIWPGSKPGDGLFFILEPVRYSESQTFNFNFNPETQGERAYFTKRPPRAELGGDNAFYWQIRPWYGDGEPPISEWTLDLPNEKVYGHYWRVGRHDYEMHMTKDKTNGLLQSYYLKDQPLQLARSMRNIYFQGQVKIFVDLNTQTSAL